MESSFIAYIHKHKIFPEKTDKEQPSKKSKNKNLDFDQILQLIDSMETVTFRKAIN